MAHFAKLDNNNVVLEVCVVNNDALDSLNEEASGIAFLTEWSGGYSNWKQTSYNHKIRKQYAGVGYKYNADADVFISPRPFASWTLNDNYDWIAPVLYPSDDKSYRWDEGTTSWVEVTQA